MHMFSGPGGAQSCSQERKLLVCGGDSMASPGGAASRIVARRCRPAWALARSVVVTRALRPWLHDVAPPELQDLA
jgi:hypothetical protein